MLCLSTFPKCYIERHPGRRGPAGGAGSDHAPGWCDRGLLLGYTLEHLRAQEEGLSYAAILRHSEIGTGLNDYPAIFRVLREVGFDGWISI